MKRKISVGLEAVIATGSYQNLRPSFYDEITFDDGDLTEERIEQTKTAMYDKAFQKIKEVENKAIIERIERERKDIRFYIDPKDGKTKGSVTSVINWDIDFFMSPIELRQHASVGNITHKRCEIYIETGKWLQPKEIDDCWTDLVIIQKGELKLDPDCGSLPTFLEKFPFKDLKNGHEVYLEETAGTFDAEGIPDFKSAEAIPTIIDFKKTPDKIKDGMQLSQYCKGKGYKQGIIVPLNNKTQQGYSKPTVYDEKALKGYDKMFQQKLKSFKMRYGV